MSEVPALPVVPDAVRACDGLIREFDRCLALGFSRLAEPEYEVFERLKGIFAGTPLSVGLDEAVQGVMQSTLTERHFAVLASARAALQGSQYGAVRGAMGEWVGVQAAVSSAPLATDEDAPPLSWLESTRHWLTEIALNGLNQLQSTHLLPFFATLNQLQSHPQSAGLAMLLTGVLDEWLAALPIHALPNPPLRRWADLWTRAMVSAIQPVLRAQGRTIKGVLYPLVAHLNHHPKAVNAIIYAILEIPQEPVRLVRCPISTFKVDLITNADVWPLFGEAFAPLLAALGQHKSLKIQNMTLCESGDLIWNGDSDPGTAFNLWALAEKHLSPGASCLRPSLDPIDHHPAQLAELVFCAAPPKLVQSPRFSHAIEAEFGAHKIQNAEKMLGLICYDAQEFQFLPLAIAAAKPKPFSAHCGALAASTAQTLGRKDSPLPILRERASRLLRATPASKRA